jgi:hypothetical protein
VGNAYKILVGKLKGVNHSEDLGIDERVIIVWILEKLGGRMCTGFVWLRTEISGGLL